MIVLVVSSYVVVTVMVLPSSACVPGSGVWLIIVPQGIRFPVGVFLFSPFLSM